MIRRLVAIGFIFVCTAIAWAVLGGTIFARTYSSDAGLKARVERIWGAPQVQQSPSAWYSVRRVRQEEAVVDGKKVLKAVEYDERYDVPLSGSDVNVDLALDHRQKGLLWYATYRADYAANYEFRNESGAARLVTVSFPFPAQNANYDDFRFQLRGREWVNKPQARNGSIEGALHMAPGETAVVDVGFRSNGLDRWSYRFNSGEGGAGVSEVKNFRLTMKTDFDDIDFPDDAISPGAKEKTANGWRLTWQYKDLIAGVSIGMLLPQKLQPGPLAGEISLFAPVSLFFFIVVMLAFTMIRGIDLHPMHFFFLSAAFFAFHLLLAYLVDHISIHAAFVIASLVSLGLVVSYLRVAVGRQFAFVEAAMAQGLYLVLFSYAFFFKGLTGLAVTIGAIVTLFVLMQMTARVRWSEVFAKKG